jgi:putative FmdB family regulatory protein
MFDFRCPQCGHTQEKLVKTSELKCQPCPKDGTLMERQHTVGTLSFRFNYLAEDA